jgi:hypothetical protein
MYAKIISESWNVSVVPPTKKERVPAFAPVTPMKLTSKEEYPSSDQYIRTT